MSGIPKTRLLAAVVCTLAGLASAGWAVMQGPDAARSALDSAVSPGPLIPLHAGEQQAQEDCMACHSLTNSIPDNKCLKCHQEISKSEAEEVGVHPTFEGSCATCHPDHGRGEAIQLDPQEFNHARARYPLEGAHAALKCEACHEKPAKNLEGVVRLRYQDLAHGRCQDCHEDPHAEQFGAERCETCHSASDWKDKELRFDHDRDCAFALDGAHTELACAKCHDRTRAGEAPASLAAAWLRKLPAACADCHKDPHAAQFKETACTVCHSQTGWNGQALSFDHDADSSFPLDGAHRKATCLSCHDRGVGGEVPPASLAASQMKGVAEGCADCHEDPHAKQFAAETCADCHSEIAWGGEQLIFDHGRTKFPLKGSHAALDCKACHGKTPAGSPTTTLAKAKLRGVGTRCTDCHDDPHKGSLAKKSCTDCHDSTRWSGPTALRFDHDTDSRFALDATHAPLSCAACHDGLRFRPLKRDCVDCHEDSAQAVRGQLAGSTPSPPSPHSGLVSCAKCHVPSDRSPSAEVYAARCGECHTPHHRQLFFERSQLAGRLGAEARAAGGPGAAKVDRLLANTHHDFLAVKAALEALAKPNREK